MSDNPEINPEPYRGPEPPDPNEPGDENVPPPRAPSPGMDALLSESERLRAGNPGFQERDAAIQEDIANRLAERPFARPISFQEQLEAARGGWPLDFAGTTNRGGLLPDSRNFDYDYRGPPASEGGELSPGRPSRNEFGEPRDPEMMIEPNSGYPQGREDQGMDRSMEIQPSGLGPGALRRTRPRSFRR